MLYDLVAHHEAYEQARQRNLTLLGNGIDMGTHGEITWKRDELHER